MFQADHRRDGPGEPGASEHRACTHGLIACGELDRLAQMRHRRLHGQCSRWFLWSRHGSGGAARALAGTSPPDTARNRCLSGRPAVQLLDRRYAAFRGARDGDGGDGGAFIRGTVTGAWDVSSNRAARPRPRSCGVGRDTEEIDRLWPQISPRVRGDEQRVRQVRRTVLSLLLYVIDNEIHHRGQGYVYLRALGIEPPPFYER